jgi:hypothetical protein
MAPSPPSGLCQPPSAPGTFLLGRYTFWQRTARNSAICSRRPTLGQDRGECDEQAWPKAVKTRAGAVVDNYDDKAKAVELSASQRLPAAHPERPLRGADWGACPRTATNDYQPLGVTGRRRTRRTGLSARAHEVRSNRSACAAMLSRLPAAFRERPHPSRITTARNRAHCPREEIPHVDSRSSQ